MATQQSDSLFTCAGWARGRPAQVECKRGGQRAVAPVGERRYDQAPVEAHVLIAVCKGTCLTQETHLADMRSSSTCLACLAECKRDRLSDWSLQMAMHVWQSNGGMRGAPLHWRMAMLSAARSQ